MCEKKITYLLKKYREIPIEGKASFWFLISSFFLKGIAFITTPIFTRVLSTAEYGIINVFSTWQTIFMIFATLNLSGGFYTRGLLDYEDKKFTASVQGLSTVLGVTVSCLLLLFSKWTLVLLDVPIYVLICLCLYMVVYPGLEYWAVEQRFRFRYKALVCVTIGSSISISLLGIAAVLEFSEKVVAKLSVTLLIGCLWAIPFYVHNFVKGKRFYNKDIWISALKFNLPLVFHYLSNVILNQSDRVMIKEFCGEGESGIYSLAYSIAVILQIFTEAIIATFTPWRYQKLQEKQYSDVNKMSVKLLAIVGIIVLGIVAMTPEVVFLLAPVEYHEAMWMVPPLTVSIMFMFVYNFFSCIEFFYKKTKYMMFVSSAVAMLNIGLNYLFIKWFGYMGCAYATLLCYITFCGVHYFCVKAIIKKNGTAEIYNIKHIIMICAVIFLLSIGMMMLYNHFVIKNFCILICLIVMFLKRKQILECFKVLKR